ncbi:hypothetical protein Nepgr_009965 [Nepenthes gracilis]|uniref:Uncharacterized protein n=1 Tax=Nepenthes gracilis TaxID=150966 RepID=A0AAD3SCC1_NEPGR|nr:hypothetical protein Nepgr_009965 [Nepenthes gracilis]
MHTSRNQKLVSLAPRKSFCTCFRTSSQELHPLEVLYTRSISRTALINETVLLLTEKPRKLLELGNPIVRLIRFNFDRIPIKSTSRIPSVVEKSDLGFGTPPLE